jgi:GNAT superfamily N-acetyltransferase
MAPALSEAVESWETLGQPDRTGTRVTPPKLLGLDAAACEALALALGDTPETVIAVHLLCRGLCSAYAAGDLSRPNAIVVQPREQPDEPTAFGTDAGAIWGLMLYLPDWTCINVDSRVAPRLGAVMQSHLGRPVRYYGDIFHTLGRTAPAFAHPAVRLLTRDDLDLLVAAPPEVRNAAMGFGPFGDLLDEGIAAGAVVDGSLVALACTTAVTARHADVGVVTAGPWRGRGLATACAAFAAEEVRQSGRVPVWSAGESNVASLRVAQKLGFEEVCRRTYIIPTET